MADDEVQIKIIAKIDELNKNLDIASTNIKKFSKKTIEETGSMKESWLNLNKAFDIALGINFASIISSAGSKLSTFIYKSIKQGIEFQQQLRQLEFQTKGTADALVNDLGSALDGTVSDLDLVKAANRAIMLQLDKNQLPALFEAAGARAKVMGITTTQAINDIVTGIGRGSPLILDNLGIVMDLEKTMTDYAKTLGKSADELNKFERAQALTNATIQSSEAIVNANKVQDELLGTSIEKVTASVKNLATALGTIIANNLLELKSNFDDVSLSTLKNSESYQLAAQSALSYANNISTLTSQSATLNDELKTTQSNLNNLFSSGVKTDKELSIQREINKLSRDELLIKQAVRETGGGIEIINKDKYNELKSQGINVASLNSIRDEKQNLQNELNYIQSEKLVLQDEEKQNAIDIGALKSEASAKDLNDLKNKMQSELNAYTFNIASQKTIAEDIKLQNERLETQLILMTLIKDKLSQIEKLRDTSSMLGIPFNEKQMLPITMGGSGSPSRSTIINIERAVGLDTSDLAYNLEKTFRRYTK